MPPQKRKLSSSDTQKAAPKRPKEDHPSVNELKKQIRNAKRLLSRTDLPADTRVVQERALAEYTKDLDNETKRRHRSEMIGRYHFVRFLDRKSANKNLRKLLIQQKEEEVKSKKEEGGSNPTTTQDLTRRIHTARVNLNYTIFFPLTEKYIALYADEQKKKKGKEKGRGKTSEDHSQSDVDDEVSQSDDTPKPDMWYIVERCMKEDAGKLELLREGKLDTSSPGLDVLPAEGEEGGAGDSGTKSNRKEKRKGRGEEKEPEETSRVSDDSDGGFFE